MADSAARLLALLALLQTPREWRGNELADRLGVTARTVRRDVDRLRALGYPVEATLGALGGYRLAAGATMPPLLLDDDEAVALALALRTSVAHGVELGDASARALAKLGQMLPARLRARVAAVAGATSAVRWDAPTIDPDVVESLTRAIAIPARVRFLYRSADGTEGRREAEPVALVAVGRRWYLVAWATDRADWRTFRVDRVTDPWVLPRRIDRRELPGGDPAAWVRERVEAQAPSVEAVATVELPASVARARLGDAVSGVEALNARRCRVTLHADTIPWLAMRLMLLEAPVVVEAPAELAYYLRTMTQRLTAAAGPGMA